MCVYVYVCVPIYTGMEILRQCTRPIDAIFIPVGGGGLIAGIASYVKRLRPEIKIIGVEPTGANALYQVAYAFVCVCVCVCLCVCVCVCVCVCG